jgi:hypothetical protein
MATRIASNFEEELLLDCALAHKAEHVRNFLDQIGQARSGTKNVLRDRLRDYLDVDGKNAVALTEQLNLIEGWGNQHVYLYNAPIGLSKRWRSQDYVEEVAKKNGVLRVINRPRPVILPSSPTLASIAWTPDRVRFIWNERREWLERREDADIEATEEALVFHAFEKKTARGTLAFDWDLQSGDSMLMIQRLPTGTNYAGIRDEMIEWLGPFVDLSTFDVVRVSPAIKSILEIEAVRDRRTRWETIGGGRATFTSPGIDKGIRADETLRRMEAAGGDDLQGGMGNMYWRPDPAGGMTQEFHTTLHRKDQRVGIMGEKNETEVRYVISRIRAHCQ